MLSAWWPDFPSFCAVALLPWGKDGSWIDGTMGAVSAGLDAPALVSDPIDSLIADRFGISVRH